MQGVLPGFNRGGKRRGAGRKSCDGKRRTSHKRREDLAARHPVHVTVRCAEQLPPLRTTPAREVLEHAFASGGEKEDFRLVHYSIQVNHLHLIVEAEGREALSLGMQGLLIRIARGLNRLWGRKGKVFPDRFHAHILRTPKEVRHALCYVLHNARKHRLNLAEDLDPFSSARWFMGWEQGQVYSAQDGIARPVAEACTWLLRVGWKRAGPISVMDVPRMTG